MHFKICVQYLNGAAYKKRISGLVTTTNKLECFLANNSFKLAYYFQVNSELGTLPIVSVSILPCSQIYDKQGKACYKQTLKLIRFKHQWYLHREEILQSFLE